MRASPNARTWTWMRTCTWTSDSANFARRIRTNAHRSAVVLCHRACERTEKTSCLRHTVNFATTSSHEKLYNDARLPRLANAVVVAARIRLLFGRASSTMSESSSYHEHFRVIPNVWPQRDAAHCCFLPIPPPSTGLFKPPLSRDVLVLSFSLYIYILIYYKSYLSSKHT